MDTIPFHFLMFALDMLLWGGLFFWFLRRGPARKDVFFDHGMPSEVSEVKASVFDPGVVLLLAGCGLFGIAFFAKIFGANFGQCAVEGLTYHGSMFLLVAGALLFRKRRRWIGMFSILFALFLFGLGFDMLVLEPYGLVVERYEIETSKLKKPLRIVFVTDIQTDRIGRHERRTLEKVMEQNADLILLGGDYLQYYPGTIGTENLPERFRNLFLEIPLSAPLGVFAVGGNLDPPTQEAFRDYFTDTGVEALYFSEIIENLGVEQERGPIDLALLSVNDSVDGVEDRGLTDTGNFQIMVGHYPNFAIKDYRHSERSPDLMLAGHTHGGQVALPFYGPIRIKFTGREAIIGREFLRGMKEFSNGGRFLISRGSGMERGWAPRVRFLCPPEISVIDLVPVEK